jgi:signal transduction histidine kinase
VSLGYSLSRLSAIDQQALAIATNAAPSVEHLAAARAELFRLGANVREYAGETLEHRDSPRRGMLDARDHLVAEIASYQSLSEFPGEREIAAELTRSLAALDDELRRILDGEPDPAAVREMHATLQSFGAVVQRLVALNASELQQGTRDILATRRKAVVIAVTLGSVTVFLAIVATVLATRATRHHLRLLAERRRLIEARASELEAFAGRVAHDIKGPLSTIGLLGFSSTRFTASDAKACETFDRIVQQVARMSTMIDALLDFARSGARPRSGARSEIRPIIEQVIEEVRPAAGDQQVDLRIGRLDDASVACASGAVAVILSNLVRNAVKYIDGGPAREVEVRALRRPEGALIEVEDTGRGLPPSAERTIFEPYVRLDHSDIPGLGLGLATVKRLVAGYRGDVGVRSKEGQGSCFWFILPLAPAGEVPKAKSA